MMDDAYFDDGVYDIGNFTDFVEDSVTPPAPVEAWVSPESYYEKSHMYWCQVPMPAECVPRGGAPLAALDDDTLLGMSPTLIAHAQRSAASGGLQVVSPRAISLAAVAAHTQQSTRTTDMFIVGSVASMNLDWPVLRDPIPARLFPGMPIDASPTELAVRMPTKSVGIAAACKGVSDPVTRAFLIGRAIVDLQRRPDVGGSGDALSSAVAQCWGVDPEVYMAMSEASLAPMGPLLRYATRADDAYPVLNAPIQARKCISVAANTAGRQLYGADKAIDWRRIRVMVESVYYNSMVVEGYNLAQMSLLVPPGDPRASPVRRGTLQFRPLPGSVWTHDPATFRVDMVRTDAIRAAVKFPARIAAAVRDFYAVARPVAAIAWAGSNVSMAATLVSQPTARNADTIITGYLHLMRANTSFSSRGKTSAAAVRDYIYQALTGSSSLAITRTLWMLRYLRESARQAGLSHLIDETLVRHAASRLSDVGHDMRIRLAVEAQRRASTLDAWWEDIVSGMPAAYKRFREGATSWAIVVVYYMLFPPTDKWVKLASALAHASHMGLAAQKLTSVRLPAVIGSVERVFEAGRTVLQSLAASYGAFYGAMFDVAALLAAQAHRSEKTATRNRLHVAGLMWDIRAKAASTARFHMPDGTSTSAGMVRARTSEYHLTTAPYPAYKRWLDYMNTNRAVSQRLRAAFPARVGGMVSTAFLGKTEPLYPISAAERGRLFRYVNDPALLGVEIEQTLGMMTADVAAVVQQYEAEALLPAPSTPPGTRDDTAPGGITVDLAQFRPAPGTYWALLADLGNADALAAEDAREDLPDTVQEDILSRTWATAEEMLATVLSAQAAQAAGALALRDVIV